MFDCYYYWLFAPVRTFVTDNADRKSAFELNVVADDGKAYEIRLYCDDGGHPEFARCLIPALTTKEIPEDIFPLLLTVREHLISSLRLTFRQDLMLGIPSVVYMFVDHGKDASLSMKVEQFGEESFDANRARDIFSLTFDIRQLIRLYVDGADQRIPMQYRYLSFYKLVENHFRMEGYWNYKALNEFLAPFKASFDATGLSGAPTAILHELRDRCAHIKTGKGKKGEILGVTQLNHAQLLKVEKIIPILRAIGAKIINERAAGRVVLSTEVLPEPGLRPSGETA